MQQHKQRAESYSKAAAAIKKQRKKRSSALDKELKVNGEIAINKNITL